jgi:acetyl-CoA carboxylase biotin carboxyl carrier protein
VNLTHEDVQEILRLLDASPFDELQLETDRFKLTLRRGGGGAWTQENHTLTTARLMKNEPPAAPANDDAIARNAGAPGATTAPTHPTTINILTPIIGTFYRAPKPGAAPFVEVGSQVTPDTVVGIVETMKLMNSVYAGAHGKVSEICQDDGKFVEQDQVLMRLDPRPNPAQA